jgi:hypothetical protein
MKDDGDFIFRFKSSSDSLRNSSQTLLNFHVLLLIAPLESDHTPPLMGRVRPPEVQSPEDLG